MFLTLSLAGVSVTMNKFLNNEYPRVGVNSAKVEYSIDGTPATSGSYTESKYLWVVNAIVSPSQKDLLEIIWWESEDRRRRLTNDADILIYDRTSTVKEKTPRSRGIVPNAAEVMINENYIAYYAQFWGIMTTDLKFSKLGIFDAVSFSMAETVRVVS